jgi:signal transduction histidine kinase
VTEPPGAPAGRDGDASDDQVTAIEIISTVSHELRSPLTSIKGFTSLLLSRWDTIDDDRKREMLEVVRHDADRVTRMLTELLDISRLETGRLVLSPRPVLIGDLIRSVVAKVAVGEPELDVTVVVDPAVPEVLADADKVEQVLTNLVENAAKYASPTGMRITASPTAEGGVAVAVADRGEGIPAADLPRVFARFYRREEGRPTGTGLGLWISRGLVEAHGGTLTAASVEGEGSTFTFTLPPEVPAA